jgi:hypothetical protein
LVNHAGGPAGQQATRCGSVQLCCAFKHHLTCHSAIVHGQYALIMPRLQRAAWPASATFYCAAAAALFCAAAVDGGELQQPVQGLLQAGAVRLHVLPSM